MNRRNFITDACTACLSATAISALLTSCRLTKYLSGDLNKDGVTINLSDFEISHDGKTTYRPYIIVRNDALKFPICVYRFNDSEYSALWMQCAHQGAELQASGSFLQCPAHGSEFDSKGRVTSGPATSNLRSFPVTINDHQLFIDLRKK